MNTSENTGEDVPFHLSKAAAAATEELLPSKSKERYEKQFQIFEDWRRLKNVTSLTEDVFLAYFAEKSSSYKASSLWSTYSMLKAVLLLKENLDISKFCKVTAYLKRKSTGYQPKKSKCLSRDQIDKFLLEAPDKEFLLMKVALIFGVSGACRCDELSRMLVDDIEDQNNVLIVHIPDSKTKKPRRFVVVDERNLATYRRYLELRPPSTPHKRLFLNYKKGKCTVQPVGLHSFGKFPSQIATYLGCKKKFVMEEFNKKAKEQEDLGKKIQTLLTNARKDPAKRKTQNWRSKRAEQLQEFWNEIQQNHEELKVLGPTLRTTHNYFEVKYFDQLKALHEDAKKYLESVQTSPDVDPEQEARIRRQLFRLQKISTELTKIKSDLDQDYSRARYELLAEKIQGQWRSIMELHEEIYVHEREFEDKYFADEMYEKTERKYCQDSHSIYECPDFQAESPEDRWRFINNEQLCTNCLSHDAGKQCFSTASCHKCKRRHHTLLHNDRRSNPKASLITEKAATLLSLPREHIQADITGLGGEIPNKSNSKIRVECAPRFSSDFTLTTDLLVLPKITESLPEEDIETDLQVWQNHIIADPVFQDKDPIDVLLGAGEYRNIILNGIQKTNDGLMGQKTEFGWILSGTIIKEEKRNNKRITVKSMMTRKENRQAAKIGKTASRPKQNPPTLRKMASVPVTPKPTTRPVVANLAPPKIHQQLTPIKEAMVQAEHTKRIRKGRRRKTVRTLRNNVAKDNSAHCKIQRHHQQHRPNNDHGCNLGSMVPHYRKKQRTQPRPQEEAVKMRPTYPPRVS
ncbi:hypothetical protein Zmor_014537 [Zophobas morio]|uniref:Peptidase aspartic putative domain-containing protein n=1 Tax=Zophobas morio TaxID=2755281 RepID=A0AA38IG42_9CUCU|nr:hypothetical protein Zmor_014537 [Zophobas morio]